MPILNPLDPIVSDQEIVDALIEIENSPVQADDQNIFVFDAISRFRMQQIVEHFDALDAAGEAAHRDWVLIDNTVVQVTKEQAYNYFRELSEKAAIRAVAARVQADVFLAATETIYSQLQAWKNQYQLIV